jgi:hypothetical protein
MPFESRLHAAVCMDMISADFFICCCSTEQSMLKGWTASERQRSQRYLLWLHGQRRTKLIGHNKAPKALCRRYVACKRFEMSHKIAVDWWYSAAAAPVLAPRSLNLRRCLIAQLNCAHKSRCIEKLQAVVGIVAVVVKGGAALQESKVGRRR